MIHFTYQPNRQQSTGKLICNKLLGYVDANNSISSDQHGFCSEKSIFSQILTNLSDWTTSVDNEISIIVYYECAKAKIVSVVYYNYKAKAFNAVFHSKLLDSINIYAIIDIRLFERSTSSYIYQQLSFRFSSSKINNLIMLY